MECWKIKFRKLETRKIILRMECWKNRKPKNNNDWINNYENGKFGNLEIGILKILFKDGNLKINE